MEMGVIVLSLPNLWKRSATTATERMPAGKAYSWRKIMFKSCFWVRPQLLSCNKSLYLNHFWSTYAATGSLPSYSPCSPFRPVMKISPVSPTHIDKTSLPVPPTLTPAPCDFSFVMSGIVLGPGPVVLYLHGTEFRHGSVMKFFHPHPKVMFIVRFVCSCVGFNASALAHTSVICTRALHVLFLPDLHQCYLCAMSCFITSCL